MGFAPTSNIEWRRSQSLVPSAKRYLPDIHLSVFQAKIEEA